jgi:HD-GYP domain-containing protein (c-di-GMP phosphodiesterase class II)
MEIDPSLKKIPIEMVRPGMFIHSLEGSWLDHSVWSTRFLVRGETEARKLHACGVAECWIDTDRGLDVEDTATVQVMQIDPPPDTEVPEEEPSPMVLVPSVPTHTLLDELNAARKILALAKEVVLSLFQEVRLAKPIDPEICMPLVSDVLDSIERNRDALVSLSRLKRSDEHTYMHSIGVCALMVTLARQFGHTRDQCFEAGLAGLLHDLGKAAMPTNILNKPGKLTDSELRVIQHHPARGHEMLVRSGIELEGVLDVCLHHHERVDGAGYPEGLAPANVSQLARMAAICDVYDTVTSNKPYKAGWDPAESIARMASWKGQFDEQVLRAFIRSMGIYPIGSLVRLSSGRLAVVVEQSSSKLSAPCVKVCFSTTSGLQLKPELVDLSSSASGEKIVAREPPDKWPFLQLDSLWIKDIA